MDALKSIPSGFFDAIARIVPGSVAIVLSMILSDRTWRQIADSILGEGVVTGDKGLTFLTVFFFVSYVAGQLIAPFAKLVQRFLELKWLAKRFFKRRLKDRKTLENRLEAVKKEELEKGKSPERELEKRSLKKELEKGKWLFPPKAEGFDYLRMYYAFPGAQCAKIRAEFTMFNSLAVVFLTGTIFEVAMLVIFAPRTFSEFVMFPGFWTTVLMIVLLISTAWRGRTVRDTFNETVKKFVEFTPFPERPRDRSELDS